MRAALILAWSLLAISANAAERVWTIAREVYTAEGELVAVRGGVAYLKIDGKIEEIPIERLSAMDQNYIASLSLAPVLPGPAATDGSATTVSPAVAQEEMPLPGPPDVPEPGELELNAPELAPAYGGDPIRPQSTPQPRVRYDRYGRVITPQPGTAANYAAPWGAPRQPTSPSDGTSRLGPQQNRNDRGARSRDDDSDNDDDRPGIFGFRARRIERERAAANRAR